MKVRKKFTIWIALTAMFSASLISFFLIFEANEEISELVEYELEALAKEVFEEVGASTVRSYQFDVSEVPFAVEHYWLRLINGNGEIIYETQLAKQTDIPIQENGKSYTFTRNIPHQFIWVPPEEQNEVNEMGGDEVKLQAQFFKQDVGGEVFSLLLAKPLLLIVVEFQEVIRELILGIVITIMVTVIIAYLVTGKILGHLSIINQEIREIRESSLDRRIPLGRSKDELYELSSELNSMFDRLQFSFDKQREFIGNASHEMKSPLTILTLGHEEMLMSDLPWQVRNELESQLETLQRLNKLIRDLLSIARLEQQDHLVGENISIKSLLESILKNYSDAIKRKGIRVSTDISDVIIYGDYEKLNRLFINLIDNSIKYNLNDRGSLQVKIDTKDREVSVKIINSGEPIPEEDLPHIFNQFYRVEKSRSQTFGGSGLGLTIAKRIAEMHRGEIEVESNEKFIKFIVTIPR